MAQVTLNPSKDNRLTSAGYTTVNYGTDGLIYVGEWKTYSGYQFRTVMAFDLSSIPSSSIITAAKLRLYDTGGDFGTNTRTMRVYRMLRSWTETGSTWNTYDGSNNWGTAGAANTTSDREAADIGNISMPGTESAGYVEITLTASKIQEWLSGALTNNGLLLQMDTETDDAHEFNSREAGSNKPELVITYTPKFVPKIIII